MAEQTQLSYSGPFVAIVIIVKVTGLLSMVGSCSILHDLLIKSRQKLKRTRSQLILCMSVSDVLSSLFMHFIGTWFVPKGLAYGSAGNTATCAFQGFIGMAATLMSYGFSVALALNYTLAVRYYWDENRLRRMKPFMILFPIIIALALCVPAIILKLFVWSDSWTCDVCESDLVCSRPTEAQRIKSAVQVLVIAYFCITLVSMFFLFWTVLQKERAGDRFQFRGSTKSRKQTKKVAVQGLLYVGAFFLTIFFYFIIEAFGVRQWWAYILLSVTAPLQGFFNAIIYFRPHYSARRKRKTRKRFQEKNQQITQDVTKSTGAKSEPSSEDINADTYSDNGDVCEEESV